ncbi:hypothetical protein N657DRAFT_342893 [Parathielavia appendiculata]|uniref:C2H2-type domain-containing protein n=1 Tax=Parathielavia appendiculata TaxID=2587402 RepID=A0AAN6U2I7_9PEZI|nr:hypothetical protein N657DRAFT_342893 [Parathielavia appendiculata]
MGASTVASQRPLPFPDTQSTRYPSHASPAMSTILRDSHVGPRPASPLTGVTPRLPSLTASSSIPPPPSSSSTDRNAGAPITSVLTAPSGAVSDGFPPSGGAHSGYPHTSQAGGHPLYFASHMTGSWPTPGLSQPSAYTYSNSNSGAPAPGPLAQPSYHRAAQSYGSGSSPFHQHFPGRASSSAPSGETIAAPQSYLDQQGFQSPVGVGGAGAGGGGNLGSPLNGPGNQESGLTQPMLRNSTANTPRQAGPGQNTPAGGSAAAQEGSSYRPPPTPTNYYSHSSAPPQPPFTTAYAPTVTQPSPTNPPPATSSPSIPRGPSSIPAVAPPLQYPGGRAYPPTSIASYASYSAIPGPVLSNMHHPGGALAMVGSMSGLSSYSHHPGLPPHHPHHVYVHPGGPSPQSERPFKCNTCPQAFNRNHDLKRHQRIHLAVKPFGCGDCDKRFSRKDALKRHRLVKGCGGASPPDGMAGGNERSSKDRVPPRDGDAEGSPRMKTEGP